MKYEYLPKEWFEDWGVILDGSQTVRIEDSMEHAKKYFESRYPDQEEAHCKMDRVLMAYRYLDEHSTFLEENGGWVLHGPTQGHVSKSMAKSLYRFFGYADDQQVLKPPSPETFIEIAKEHENHES